MQDAAAACIMSPHLQIRPWAATLRELLHCSEASCSLMVQMLCSPAAGICVRKHERLRCSAVGLGAAYSGTVRHEGPPCCRGWGAGHAPGGARPLDGDGNDLVPTCSVGPSSHAYGIGSITFAGMSSGSYLSPGALRGWSFGRLRVLPAPLWHRGALLVQPCPQRGRAGLLFGPSAQPWRQYVHSYPHTPKRWSAWRRQPGAALRAGLVPFCIRSVTPGIGLCNKQRIILGCLLGVALHKASV